MKLRSSLACLSSLQTEMQWAFWSLLCSLGTNASPVQIVHQNALNGPVWQSYYLTNIMVSFPMICKDSLMNFCYVFQCCACWQSSRMLIVMDRCLSLKRLYHKKVLLWLMELSLKASCSIRWVFAAVYLRVKQNLLQVLCSLISVISCKKNRWIAET
jgi:hypothetical protein